MIATRIGLRTVLVAVALALGVLVAISGIVLGVTLARGGKAVTAVRTLTTNEFISTSSTSFIDMPGTAVTVTVPAGEKGLLVVTFSAVSYCGGSSPVFCEVQATVDGADVSPGPIVFDSARDGSDNLSLEANTYHWVASGVSPGSHSVKIRFRVDVTIGSSFNIYTRTLTVLRSRQ